MQPVVAESELNRALLSEDWQAMTHGVANLAHQAKTIVAWASSAGVLVADGARMASSIWLAFRAQAEEMQRK